MAVSNMAVSNIEIQQGAVFHSDRGSKYTSMRFAGKLAGMGMRQSRSDRCLLGQCAMAESFFGTLKNERLNRFEFTERAKTKRHVVKYIEGFYNRRRIHSALEYRTPKEVEDEYFSYRLAA